jgi:hypothetical protein
MTSRIVVRHHGMPDQARKIMMIQQMMVHERRCNPMQNADTSRRQEREKEYDREDKASNEQQKDDDNQRKRNAAPP